MWAQVGFVDPNVAVAKVRPIDFESAARRACDTRLDDAKATFPSVEPDNLPYLCMDLVYQYTLLVDGFGKTRFILQEIHKLQISFSMFHLVIEYFIGQDLMLVKK